MRVRVRVRVRDASHNPDSVHTHTIIHTYASTSTKDWLKRSDWSGIRTHDLPITCRLLFQLSYPVNLNHIVITYTIIHMCTGSDGFDFAIPCSDLE